MSRLLGPDRLSCLAWDVEAGRLAAGNEEGVLAVWSVARIRRLLAAHRVSARPPARLPALPVWPRAWRGRPLACRWLASGAS